ncbi:MAG: L,D-transpeptidase family protein [Chthoniobacter sp.]|nr:L,D-transpeptidase family protein [Chthoniobacter sp.]
MRFPALLIFLVLPMSAPAADVESALPRSCRQVVRATTTDWRASAATVQRFERSGPEARWMPVGKAMSALTGERGLAWGRGLHPMPRAAEPRKSEGDRRAPAGVFRITGAFGRPEKMIGLRLPATPLSTTLEAVDDPASRYYNRIVDRAKIAQPDWRTSERMSTLPVYALGLVVAHNPCNVPGAGSCIFLHLWTPRRTGTAGCTVLRECDLKTLARWLNAARTPVLVQLPQAETAGWPATSARGS